MSTNTSEKEYFLFFENGENANQLKNKASKQISLLRKQKVPSNKIPSKSQILNDLAKSINGKAYNISVFQLKPLAPYLENEAYFTIPFKNEKNIFHVSLFSEILNYNKEDEYPIENILFLREIVVTGLVNNIFNIKYVSNGYYYTYDDTWTDPTTTTIEGTGYYPQATINFLIGATVKF